MQRYHTTPSHHGGDLEKENAIISNNKPLQTPVMPTKTRTPFSIHVDDDALAAMRGAKSDKTPRSALRTPLENISFMQNKLDTNRASRFPQQTIKKLNFQSTSQSTLQTPAKEQRNKENEPFGEREYAPPSALHCYSKPKVPSIRTHNGGESVLSIERNASRLIRPFQPSYGYAAQPRQQQTKRVALDLDEANLTRNSSDEKLLMADFDLDDFDFDF